MAKERIDRDDEDLVRLYLTDIGQYVLLTKDDEVRLAKAIEEGKTAEATLKKTEKQITPTRRRELNKVVRAGARAERQFVQSNLRLVVSIAKKYQASGLPLLDLIQEGNIGLMHAADKYDYEKGFKFSTYATWWIRQSMTRALADQGRNIRIPGHMMEVVNRVQRAERDLTAELGRMPSPEEVALRSSLTVEKLLDIMQLAIPTTSLDAPVGYNTDDLTVGDTIADTDENDPISSTERSQLREAVERTLKDLPEREQEIVAMRFGIGQFDRIYTLEEVAEKMKVTRERVRQIEQKTLARLRHPHSNNNLRAFLDEE